MGTHETMSREDKIEVGSERSFGIVFAVVFFIIAIWPFVFGGDIRIWAMIIAAIFLIVGLFFSKILKPLNLLWFEFGKLLHKIVTPVIMFLIFATTVVPIGLIMRMLGKDLLRLKIDRKSGSDDSYWIDRSPPGPQPGTMNEQF